MRKFLFVLLIILLLVLMFFLVWYDIPSIGIVTTYTEVEDAYNDYQSTVKILKNKNEKELPAVLSKLSTEYSKDQNADLDNVVKKYNTNKEEYEYYVALEKANEMVDEADIYDVEYIWTTVGGYAKNRLLDMSIKLFKSEADLQSDDYIMCNLEFDVIGEYEHIIDFIEDIEFDSSIGFQINDFFAQGYAETARNQNKDENMDTDNIPSEEGGSEDGSSYSIASTNSSSFGSFASTDTSDEHAFDVRASFRVYNIPINKRTITNVKDKSALVTEEEEVTE